MRASRILVFMVEPVIKVPLNAVLSVNAHRLGKAHVVKLLWETHVLLSHVLTMALAASLLHLTATYVNAPVNGKEGSAIELMPATPVLVKTVEHAAYWMAAAAGTHVNAQCTGLVIDVQMMHVHPIHVNTEEHAVLTTMVTAATVEPVGLVVFVQLISTNVYLIRVKMQVCV
jgi:predicted thioesterase